MILADIRRNGPKDHVTQLNPNQAYNSIVVYSIETAFLAASTVPRVDLVPLSKVLAPRFHGNLIMSKPPGPSGSSALLDKRSK